MLRGLSSGLKRRLSAIGAAPDRDPVRILVDSGLFDAPHYATQAGLTPELERCVRDYLRRGSQNGFTPNRLFDPSAYAEKHADVAAAGVDPFVHFVLHGVDEGRWSAVPPGYLQEVAAIPTSVLRAQRVTEQARARGWRDSDAADANAVVAVYASSLGNFFFRDIADRIAHALRQSGIAVHRLDQNSERPRDVSVDFVVAPHEFFHLGNGRSWQTRPELRSCIMLNTEHPGTHWYFLALRYAAAATTMVDLSPQSSVLLRQSGRQRSAFLPLGCTNDVLTEPKQSGTHTWPRGMEALSPELLNPMTDGWSSRPIDVLFLGTLSPRRSRALASLAATFARYRCFIHAPTGSGQPLLGGKNDIGIEHSRLLARNAKVLLNLHRGELPYLEWHRIVTLGVEQGAVVVSEPCLETPGVQPGRHYLAAPIERIPAMLEELLCSPAGAALADELTATAKRELPATFDLPSELRALLFLHQHGFERCRPT